MSADALLNEISDLLARPYPDASSITSKMEIGVWMAGLEYLESRLILACVMQKKQWFNSPKIASFKKKQATQSEMTYQHLTQARLMLEQYIVQIASKPSKSTPPFPFKEVMTELLAFKATLCADPGLKRFFFNVSALISGETERQFPAISSLSSKSEHCLSWYKYYGFYKAILGVAKFDAPAIDKLKFDASWLKDDESMIVLLYAYAIESGQVEDRFPRILRQSERLLGEHPSLKPVHNAMIALVS